MFSVLKYKLDFRLCMDSKGCPIEIPKNSKILDIQYQDKDIMMWCLVDLSCEKEKVVRIFEIYGTGQPLLTNNYKHVKTLQSESGLVWHIFEKI